MLYLEDFIEMIENLPQELRDRLTEMREMDLAVQNSTDNIEKRVNVFFSNIKKMKPSEKEAEYEAIRKDYYKTLEDADEKVHLANQMHDLVDRYSRLLDQELFKFKVDLEADNKGITEILEKRSLELDQPSTNSSQKENRYSNFPSNKSRDNYSHSRAEKRRDSNASSTSIEKRVTVKKVSTPTNSNPEVRSASANSGPPVPQTSSTPTTAAATAASPASGLANSVGPVSYNLGHIGAGGNAIAAAASQAIAATQHMQQGRRTASLKASYEAINTGGVHAAEFSRELAGAAQTAIAAIQESSKKNKKKVTTASVPSTNVIPATVQQQQVQEVHQQQQPVQQQQTHQHQHQHHQQQQQVQQQQLAVTAAGAAASAATQIQATTASTASSATAQAASVTDSDNPDWTFDPNEPRYCICNQVSYGDMVACDNSDCPFEWFHYPCVNITAPPKGKWYCPQCTSSMKRRGGRKN